MVCLRVREARPAAGASGGLGGVDGDPHLRALTVEYQVAAFGDQGEHPVVVGQDVCLQVRHAAGRCGGN